MFYLFNTMVPYLYPNWRHFITLRIIQFGMVLAPPSGWTIYPPLSGLPNAEQGSGLGMTLWLFSMAIFIASSLLGSLNYIVTVINLRTKGMKMTRMPLTIWAFFVTAILGVLSSQYFFLRSFY